MRMNTNRLSTDRLCSSRYPAKNCGRDLGFQGAPAHPCCSSTHWALADKRDRVSRSRAAMAGMTLLDL